MTRALADAFLAASRHAAAQIDRAALGDAIAEIIAAARARWAEIAFDDRAVAAHLAGAWDPDAAAPVAVELPAFAVELALAHACLRGDPAALRVLDSEMFARALRVLGRLRLAGADLDDVRQDVRTKLVVGDRPKLALYEGQGPLENWIAAVAGREGLMVLRRRRATEELDDAAFIDDGDPELAMLNAQHGAELKRAFQDVVAALPPRDRTVLRALIVDDRSVNDIAALYRIHRVTASRWISEIRHKLLHETRRRLQQRLGLDPASLDSAVRLVDSDLDLSLYRLLADPR